MAGGFDASPESLRKLQNGIESLVQAQKDAGAGVGRWTQGDGLDSLDLSAMAAGGAEVKAGLDAFKDRWKYQNRALFATANEMAESVGATAKSIDENENENAINYSLKGAVNQSLLGDPNASKEELSHKSWGDVATGGRHVVTDIPDQFDPDTWRRHGKHITETWQATADDLAGWLDRRPARAG